MVQVVHAGHSQRFDIILIFVTKSHIKQTSANLELVNKNDNWWNDFIPPH